VRRRQARRLKLRWRKSTDTRRSMGWIPFRESVIRYRNSQLFFGKMVVSPGDGYGLRR
jgi:putative transposase